jgi:hypothetical protein
MRSAAVKEKEGWIVTYTGRRFYPLDPNPQDIDILDIAHALSNTCRFTGHTKEFYSVAQHSYLVSLILGKEQALAGLLHDASEAYLCDISTPVKHSRMFEAYRLAEDWLQGMIFLRFGIRQTEIPEDVREADRFVGVLEGRTLMPHDPGSFWMDSDEARYLPQDHMACWDPQKAKIKFLSRFGVLTQTVL